MDTKEPKKSKTPTTRRAPRRCCLQLCAKATQFQSYICSLAEFVSSIFYRSSLRFNCAPTWGKRCQSSEDREAFCSVWLFKTNDSLILVRSAFLIASSRVSVILLFHDVSLCVHWHVIAHLPGRGPKESQGQRSCPGLCWEAFDDLSLTLSLFIDCVSWAPCLFHIVSVQCIIVPCRSCKIS